MQNFSLELLFQIIGIGAASGLVYHENSLFVISDNSSFLYEYNISKAFLNKIPLQENSQENTPKKEKLDFEAITLKDNKLYVFGSGSTKQREIKFTYDLTNKKVAAENFSKLYQKIRKATSIVDYDLNIEGVFFKGKKWYFFQRGNGGSAKNGIIILEEETDKIEFVTVHLPKINAVEASFTDAILVGETIYFLAAAENTNSTYDDGEVLGSIIGAISFETFKITAIQQISENKKFEGLTLYKETDATISFLLCEDNDTDTLISDIYELKIQK